MPWLESSHRQNFIINIFTVIAEKTKKAANLKMQIVIRLCFHNQCNHRIVTHCKTAI